MAYECAPIQWIRGVFPVLSFRKVNPSDVELKQAQTQAEKNLQGNIYRIEIFRGKGTNNTNDQKKVKVEVVVRCVFFTGMDKEVLVKDTNKKWSSVSTL